MKLDPRSPLLWLGLLLLAAVWLLFGPRSETIITLTADGNRLVSAVNGTELQLDLSTNPAPYTGTVSLYTAPPETSQYYQPGEPDGPLTFLSRLGDLIQTARPAASWRVTEGTVATNLGNGNPAPLLATAPAPYSISVAITGGRLSTGFIVGAPGGPQYAFTVRPERRNIAIFRFENGQLGESLGNGYYRVAGPATVLDVLQEFALALGWTAVVVLFVLGLGRVLDRVLGKARSPHPNPSPARRGAIRGLFQASGFIESKVLLPLRQTALSNKNLMLADLPSPRRRGVGGEVNRAFPNIHAPSLARTSPLPLRGRGWGLGQPHLTLSATPTIQAQPTAVAPTTTHEATAPRPRTTLLWAALFGVAAFGLALWVCLGPLEGIPHVQDDVAYVFQAKIFALRMPWVPAPPLPQFFEQGFIVISEGRWFAKYPPGFPLLLAPAEILHIDWIVNPLCAGLTIALVYLTGRLIYGRRAAFWAALLGVFSPFIIFMSGSFMSHPSTMFWLALMLYCFVLSMTRPEWLAEQPYLVSNRRFVTLIRLLIPLVAGFAASYAFITREATAVGVATPFALWALIDLVAALRSGPRELLRRFRPYGLMLVGAIPPLVIMGLVNNSQMGSPFVLAQNLVGSYDRLGFGVGYGPEPEGHSPAIGLYNALVYLRELQAALFGWPLLLTLVPLVLALFAAIVSWRNGKPTWRFDLLVLGGFLGLVAIYMAWWSSTTIFGPRYWYEATPFLLLFAGRGIAWLGELAQPINRTNTKIAWAAPGIVVALLLLYNLSQYMPGEVRGYTGYNDVSASALRRAEAANLDAALVFVALEQSRSNRDYGKVFFANDPLLRGPVVYARDLGPEKNSQLLQQFPGRQPYYLPLEGPVAPGLGP